MRHTPTRVKNLNLWKCPIQMKPHDQDGDGRLGYDDVIWLMKATNDEMNLECSACKDWRRSDLREGFDSGCKAVGATDKLMTRDQLRKFFKENDGDEMDGFMGMMLDKLTTPPPTVC